MNPLLTILVTLYNAIPVWFIALVLYGAAFGGAFLFWQIHRRPLTSEMLIYRARISVVLLGYVIVAPLPLGVAYTLLWFGGADPANADILFRVMFRFGAMMIAAVNYLVLGYCYGVYRDMAGKPLEL